MFYMVLGASIWISLGSIFHKNLDSRPLLDLFHCHDVTVYQIFWNKWQYQILVHVVYKIDQIICKTETIFIQLNQCKNYKLEQWNQFWFYTGCTIKLCSFILRQHFTNKPPCTYQWVFVSPTMNLSFTCNNPCKVVMYRNKIMEIFTQEKHYFSSSIN